MALEIKKLKPEHFQALTGLLANSFNKNPMYSYIFKNECEKRQKLRNLFDIILETINILGYSSYGLIQDTNLVGSYTVVPNKFFWRKLNVYQIFIFKIFRVFSISESKRIIYLLIKQNIVLSGRREAKIFSFFAVKKEQRNDGLGNKLLVHAKKNHPELILITQNSKEFFNKRGFELNFTINIKGVDNHYMFKKINQ